MNKNVSRSLAASAAVLSIAFGATACFGESKPTTINAQNQGNDDNNSLATHFNGAPKNPFLSQDPPNPLELQNLHDRLVQFNSKGSTGYVYLLAPMGGQVIGYYVISGKVSSTGSQMTATQAYHHCDANGGSCAVTDTMGDDGSYGPSEGGPNGVFFFTAQGHKLVETVLPWIYSSQPLDIYASAPQLTK